MRELEANHPAIEWLETLRPPEKWEFREALALRIKPRFISWIDRTSKPTDQAARLNNEFARMTDDEWLVFLLRLF